MSKKAKKRSSGKKQNDTVEHRLKEHLYKQVLGITNDILKPCQSYSKLSVKNLDITNINKTKSSLQRNWSRSFIPRYNERNADITKKCPVTAEQLPGFSNSSVCIWMQTLTISTYLHICLILFDLCLLLVLLTFIPEGAFLTHFVINLLSLVTNINWEIIFNH